MLAAIIRFIVEKLHVPVTGYILLRLSLVLLGSLSALALLERRFKALARFRNEKSTALNLAVARVAVAATLLWQVRLGEILLTTSLDPALQVPFRIWGWLDSRLLGPPSFITAIYAIFVLSAVLMLIGLSGRLASAITCICAVYLISFLFLYGKVDHNIPPLGLFLRGMRVLPLYRHPFARCRVGRLPGRRRRQVAPHPAQPGIWLRSAFHVDFRRLGLLLPGPLEV
jgi:hypothetical protein